MKSLVTLFNDTIELNAAIRTLQEGGFDDAEIATIKNGLPLLVVHGSDARLAQAQELLKNAHSTLHFVGAA